jgi:hypothetical protein
VSSALFITHARTLDELRAEFCSDLRRRLDSLDAEAKFEKRVRQLAAIGRAKMELEAALRYWISVELRGARNRTPTPSAEP